jgi:large conductance mechanosensitive channel
MIRDFKAFLVKQNIVGLAIAVVVGTALNGLVKAVVDGGIMPIVLAATPDGDWQTATWKVGSVEFGVGAILAALVNFLIVGFVAWRLAKAFIAAEPATPAKATKECAYCRMSIDGAATRCAHCTSVLAG